ncbi:MAG: hypothetical protein N2651_01780 [Fimbriimonadales bacterium]|nr:hypothetical protein [Fimbriimonadales bacterium]
MRTPFWQRVPQAWRVAMYLESRRFLNSLRISWQARVGKWSLLAAAMIGLLLILIVITGGDLPQSDEWLEATAQGISESTRPAQARTLLTAIFTLTLAYRLIRACLRTHEFLRMFTASDGEYLFPTPVAATRLLQTLMVVRQTLEKGVLAPLAFVVVFVSLAASLKEQVESLQAQLFSGAWLFVSYLLLRYLEGLWFGYFELWLFVRTRVQRWLRPALVALAVAWAGCVLGVMIYRGLPVLAGDAPPERAVAAAEFTGLTLLALPARALADGFLSPLLGLTPAIGTMLAVWAVGLWALGRSIRRGAPTLRQAVALAAQYGYSADRDSSRLPSVLRAALEDNSRAASLPTPPRWLERWTLRGAGALLWLDAHLIWRSAIPWGGVIGWSVLLLIALLAPIVVRLAGAAATMTAACSYAAVVLVYCVALSVWTHLSRREAHLDALRALPFSSKQLLTYFLLHSFGAWGALLFLITLAGLIAYPSTWFLWLVGCLYSALLMLSLTLTRIQAALGMLDAVMETVRPVYNALTLTWLWLRAGLPTLLLFGLLNGGAEGAVILLVLSSVGALLLRRHFRKSVQAWQQWD